jgi:zinc transport system ATP-binding protein
MAERAAAGTSRAAARPPEGAPPARGDAGAPLLEVSDLWVRRGGEALLERVSVTVARGSLHMLVGPNGAGKSTLLAAILGQIGFSGRIVAHWRGDGRVGLVPQSFAVDRTLPVTVADFLALTRQRRPVCLGVAAATRTRVTALLARVGLAGAEDKPLSVLSGGELRRVLLAHALDPLPELLLLDEPASGLDEDAARRLEQVLVALCRGDGVTVLMVSHDLAQVRRLADRVTVLARTVRADGPAAQVLAGGQALMELVGLSAAGGMGGAGGVAGVGGPSRLGVSDAAGGADGAAP